MPRDHAEWYSAFDMQLRQREHFEHSLRWCVQYHACVKFGVECALAYADRLVHHDTARHAKWELELYMAERGRQAGNDLIHQVEACNIILVWVVKIHAAAQPGAMQANCFMRQCPKKSFVSATYKAAQHNKMLHITCDTETSRWTQQRTATRGNQCLFLKTHVSRGSQTWNPNAQSGEWYFY